MAFRSYDWPNSCLSAYSCRNDGQSRGISGSTYRSIILCSGCVWGIAILRSLFMGAGAVLHTVGSRFMTDMGGLRKYMKKTYIFMLLASLSLAGAPLVTSGFWSKDAIFAAVLESGYAQAWPLFAIATVVAVMTAFYSFRMIGMVFFGKKSEYLEEMEHSGHHLHEVGKNMWVPFAILAVATIGIGLVGFVFEGQITHLLGGYLAQSFGIGKEGV